MCNTGRDCSCQAACERRSCGKPGAEAQNPLFSMNRDHISVEGGLRQAQHSLRNLEFNPSFALDSLSEEDSDLPHRAVVRVGVCNGSPRAQGCAPRGPGSFLFIPISYALCTCSREWERGRFHGPRGHPLVLPVLPFKFLLMGFRAPWLCQHKARGALPRPRCPWPWGALGVLQPGVTPNCSSSFHLLEVVTII